MKLKAFILTGLAGIALSACTSQPTIPQLTAGVLQEVQDIEVYPDTTNNKAKLTKFEDKCVIEFTGNLKAGKVVEQWAFRDYTLITGGSATFALDGTSTATKFELHDTEVQKNFLALRNHFAKEALAQCN
ncbi:hypothetical protein [Acinetobacter johnsonii]|uniref:hypothetical protein n=1 Tax=Acinetobacter johnsonii TaxID=40214 RepID=UPI00103A3ED1|nr:hypothetical protein [Acinetobacter johnsonii]MDH1278830.1 hypothetical protein [Acinetobacter johnsonii]MDH1405905.1 hypothetical protein [Acinetobacter johnsonii]QBK68433.1 hypothetical protein E0Z08_02070 [Acinetobacter johnsonii]